MENYLQSEKRAAWLTSPQRRAALAEAYGRCAALAAKPAGHEEGQTRHARNIDELAAAVAERLYGGTGQ